MKFNWLPPFHHFTIWASRNWSPVYDRLKWKRNVYNRPAHCCLQMMNSDELLRQITLRTSSWGWFAIALLLASFRGVEQLTYSITVTIKQININFISSPTKLQDADKTRPIKRFAMAFWHLRSGVFCASSRTLRCDRLQSVSTLLSWVSNSRPSA